MRIHCSKAAKQMTWQQPINDLKQAGKECKIMFGSESWSEEAIGLGT